MRHHCAALIAACLLVAGAAGSGMSGETSASPAGERSLSPLTDDGSRGKKPATVKRKPVRTTKKEQASATGFHNKDEEEPTQEKPNPIDSAKKRGVTDPVRDPVRGAEAVKANERVVK